VHDDGETENMANRPEIHWLQKRVADEPAVFLGDQVATLPAGERGDEGRKRSGQ
jgi:hypothetical protein